MASYKTSWVKKLVNGVLTKTFAISHIKSVYYDYANRKTLDEVLIESEDYASQTVSETEISPVVLAKINAVATTQANNYALLSVNKAESTEVYTRAEVDNIISALKQECDWKESVDTFADIATTYPSPEKGWTVSVKDTNIAYRYNGSSWIDVYTFAAKATQSSDGIMLAADKKKLDGIEAGANKTTVDSAMSSTSTNPVQNKVVQAALDSKAASSHTHTKSQISDFPSSLKNPNALTVQFNGTTQKTYDGSSAQTVNITPSGIGAAASSHSHTSSQVGLGNVPNVATNNQTPTFTAASTRANIASGEKLTVILGKIAKWFSDLKNVAFSGSYNDLSDKPSSLPASDVYSWAKASSKPSYSYSEITNKPTIPSNTNQLTNGAGFITSSGSCSYASSAGNADTVDGHHFNWSGQNGQPSWLWGGNDSSNMYVYNPSNFSVNYANSAGSVAWGNVSGRPTALSSFTNDVGYKTTDTNTWRPVQNNLSSDSTTDCLSAAMGKNLQEQINTVNNNLVSHASSISYLESWRKQLTTTLASGRLSFKWNDSAGKLELYIDSSYIGQVNVS